MEILISSTLAFICLVIAFIAYTYHWLSNQKVFQTWVPVQTTIRTYNLETFKYEFRYRDPKIMQNFYLEPNNRIMTQDHVQHEIKNVARKIGAELLHNGFIEVHESPSDYNPYENNVMLTLRVYRPGHVEQKL